MERRGLLLADVSSVLGFEFCPEVVDFARLCYFVLLLGQLGLTQKAAWLKDTRQRSTETL